MNALETVAETLSRLELLKPEGEPVDVTDLLPASLQDRVEALGRIAAVKEAANLIDRQLRHLVAEELNGRAVRIGDTIYRESTSRQAVVSDPRAFTHWVGDDWPQLMPKTRDGKMKVPVTAVDDLAHSRGVSADGARDTFVRWEYGTKTLRPTPLEKAPKRFQHLREGEVQ